jgi:DNA polymerase-1
MVPPSGWVLVKADYRQIQMRILANLSNDPELVSAFRQGLDVHWLTAEMCDIKGETAKARRDKAKTVNFGILFQMTALSLSQELETDVATAQRYIRAFWKKYSVAKAYLERFVQELRAKPPEERWVRSDLGRIRRFDGAFGVVERRKAKATLLQHNEADILRIAVMNLYARLRDLKMRSRIVMLIHDAVYVEAPQKEADRAKEVLKREMESAVEMPLVPLEVDCD